MKLQAVERVLLYQLGTSIWMEEVRYETIRERMVMEEK
jgi:hypothetical protein